MTMLTLGIHGMAAQFAGRHSLPFVLFKKNVQFIELW